jgi:hypothetical protein
MTTPAKPVTLAEYLDQGDYWMSKDGGLIPITEMPDQWRVRALRWLSRNSSHLSLYRNVQEYVEADFVMNLDTMIRWVDTRPSFWVQETALWKALVKGLPTELINER